MPLTPDQVNKLWAFLLGTDISMDRAHRKLFGSGPTPTAYDQIGELIFLCSVCGLWRQVDDKAPHGRCCSGCFEV